MYFVFSDGKNFIRVTKTLRLKCVQNIEQASVWSSTSSAKTWSQVIEKKFPKLKLREAKLTL